MDTYTSNPHKYTTMIPLMLDLGAAKILVIGSGAVGRRKAEYFSSADVVIQDDVPENLEEAVAGFDIIIAATASAEVNEEICRKAAAQKKWYNSATGVGNFLIPAAYQNGGLSLAVSTSGKAPAVSAFVRDKIMDAYPSLPAMIDLQETIRAELKTTVSEQPRRAEILREILEDPAVWAALDASDMDAALTLCRRHI